MAGRRGSKGVDLPRGPGWYPDPWSATGSGERYFDGKKWGTSERFDRQEISVIPLPSRRRRRFRQQTRGLRNHKGRLRKFVGPIVFVVLVAISVAFQSRSRSHHTAANRPPPGYEESRAPIGAPADAPAGNGKFEVLNHQDGDANTPIAFDPCRPIHYVINVRGEPAGGLGLIQGAIARVHGATGLRFVYDGPTDEPPSKDRAPYQPTRYGKQRWAPVLIAWSDENAYPELAGYIDGLGSPYAEYTTNNRLVYVTGEVVLDRQQLLPSAPSDHGVARATVLHELGHLVGLGHTADRKEIMFSEDQFNVRDYGAGDLRGLALLGTQSCFPNI